TWNEFPVESWTVLSPAEAGKLLPHGAVTVGQSWELDQATTARFLTTFLPNGYGYASYHKITIVEQKLHATVVSIDKGIAQARLEGVLKLKHKSLNFNVSPPADTEEIAQMPLVGFIDFEVKEKQVRAFRLLADKATSRNGQVIYAVALAGQQPKAGAKEAPLPKETL